ncbi:MAG: lipid-A-disaccharide synthase [Pseudomonadota bacterium]|nr:lipid-A-disaccharide synthase [Pseudomonadota bacterium]
MARERLIYVIAGEPSGDAIGEKLITAIRNQYGTGVDFVGLGGPAMESVGFQSRFPISELSVMGLVEVLPHLRRILARIREIADDIVRQKPDVVVTIDSPSFTVRVVTLLVGRYQGPKIHVVAPTVWAWRPGRAHKFKNYFDHLLTILPFEPTYFQRVGLASKFIGHPVLEYGVQEADGRVFRKDHGIDSDQKLICILPGSRRGEVTRHLSIFGEALARYRAAWGDVFAVIPTVSAIRAFVEEGVSGWPKPPIIVSTPLEKYQSMKASNLALAASGTVALETALAEVPTVIAYKVSPLTAFIVRRLIKVDYVNIINVLAGKEIVPECLQEKCSPDVLADILGEFSTASGQSQIQQVRPYLSQLASSEGRPSEVAAQYIIKVSMPETPVDLL